jgi:hypothetical protein
MDYLPHNIVIDHKSEITMKTCKKCWKKSFCSIIPANDRQTNTVKHVSIPEMTRPSFRPRLAIATVNLNIPRREIPNWMADSIYGFSGRVLTCCGTPFYISDAMIDDSFNGDGSFRWISDFIKMGNLQPIRSPQKRVLLRLRLLDLSFRIVHPNIAVHFIR